MAPIGMKRHRDLASFKAKKRQRIDLENGDLQDSEGKAVGLDKLPWSQVGVDRLEDAEGFFGLEELSDVDVVRDPTLGKVEYKVCKEWPLEISFCCILTAQCSFWLVNLYPQGSRRPNLQKMPVEEARKCGKALVKRNQKSKESHGD